jgi:hypothetical protein
MKKILGLAFSLMLTAMAFAQSGITFNDAQDGYDKAATTVFHFTFDSSFNTDNLNTTGTYYTDYFTVEATAENNGSNVVITLIQNDEMSRKVIMRYMVTNKVESVEVNGESLTLDEFMGTYIML